MRCARILLDFWRVASAHGAPRRALIVAVTVGTLLNAINQGDVLLAGGEPDLGKVALTYVVPFFVSMHGALSIRRDR